MGRKGGKTQLAAALARRHLSGPGLGCRGEAFSAANDRPQAGRIFSEMVAIITRTPWLDALVNIIRFRKELEDMQNGSTYAALSADVATKLGPHRRSSSMTSSARRPAGNCSMRSILAMAAA